MLPPYSDKSWNRAELVTWKCWQFSCHLPCDILTFYCALFGTSSAPPPSCSSSVSVFNLAHHLAWPATKDYQDRDRHRLWHWDWTRQTRIPVWLADHLSPSLTATSINQSSLKPPSLAEGCAEVGPRLPWMGLGHLRPLQQLALRLSMLDAARVGLEMCLPLMS